MLSPGGVAVFQVPSEPTVHGIIMPDSSFRAQITALDDVLTIKSGSEANVTVKIKNLSETIWPHLNGELPIRLGNHWLNEDGVLVKNDDGRASLPTDLKPGEEVQLLLTINAPIKPGQYILLLDMVQEQVAWFNSKGSKTTKILVKVENILSKIQEELPEFTFTPRMEMYVLPKEDVLHLIDQCKGSVVNVVENDNAPGWVSYTYCVTK